MTQWIEVVNWDGFQHYKKSDPFWIKSYVHLLHKDEYLELTAHRRAVLHGLWLLYATKRQRLTDRTSTLSRALALRVFTADLEALADAGFIRFCSRPPLEEGYTDAIPEKETEKEKESPLARARKPDELWDALVAELGEPATASERGRRNKALKELRDIGATPSEIRSRSSVYRAMWPNLTFTATGLVANWSAVSPVPSLEEKCPECGVGFKGPRGLAAHRSTVHGVQTNGANGGS